jgi:hypothetical protein
MKARQDIQADSSRLPVIQAGDFHVSGSDEQHVLDILESAPGHYRESPLTGLDLARFILAPAADRLQREASLQLEMHGYLLTRLDLEQSVIEFELA